MPRIAVSLILALGLLALSPPAHAARIVAPYARLAACTVVAVQTVDSVNSAKAHPGDFFRFKTTNALTVGRRIVVPAHTMGYGVVAVAQSAGKGGRAGSLVLEPLYLKLSSGATLGVVLDHNAADMQSSGSSGNAPGYLGVIPGIGIALGAFNYFHHGKDVTLPRGTLFAVFPSNDPSTANCQKSK